MPAYIGTVTKLIEETFVVHLQENGSEIRTPEEARLLIRKYASLLRDDFKAHRSANSSYVGNSHEILSIERIEIKEVPLPKE